MFPFSSRRPFPVAWISSHPPIMMDSTSLISVRGYPSISFIDAKKLCGPTSCSAALANK